MKCRQCRSGACGSRVLCAMPCKLPGTSTCVPCDCAPDETISPVTMLAAKHDAILHVSYMHANVRACRRFCKHGERRLPIYV